MKCKICNLSREDAHDKVRQELIGDEYSSNWVDVVCECIKEEVIKNFQEIEETEQDMKLAQQEIKDIDNGDIY